MTTRVIIAVSGNKEVQVNRGSQKVIMQPGAHAEFLIHGESVLTVQEIGDFISQPSIPLIKVQP